MNQFKQLKLTYIGLFFFLLSLFGFPMFYLDLIILDTIRINLPFAQSLFEKHPLLFILSLFMLFLFSLFTHVILRAKKGKKLSVSFTALLFLFLAVFTNALAFEIFHRGFPNQSYEIGESFSMYWHSYLMKSIQITMWLFPVIGFILDKLYDRFKVNK